VEEKRRPAIIGKLRTEKAAGRKWEKEEGTSNTCLKPKKSGDKLLAEGGKGGQASRREGGGRPRGRGQRGIINHWWDVMKEKVKRLLAGTRRNRGGPTFIRRSEKKRGDNERNAPSRLNYRLRRRCANLVDVAKGAEPARRRGGIWGKKENKPKKKNKRRNNKKNCPNKRRVARGERNSWI